MTNAHNIERQTVTMYGENERGRERERTKFKDLLLILKRVFSSLFHRIATGSFACGAAVELKNLNKKRQKFMR